MATPRWALFLSVAGLATVAMLGMAYATQRSAAFGADEATGDAAPALSTGLLFANVAISHGLLGSVLVAVAWLARIPPETLGVAVPSTRTVALGVGFGVGLYLANEAVVSLTEGSGIEYDERLRRMLTPETVSGWIVLLGGVLPVIAGVEEFLFRAALIGAGTAASGLPIWGVAVGSSVLFGLGHGLQGPVGVVLAGAIGLLLAGGFVLTGSLAVVVIAHYLVNALEFLVHGTRRADRG